MWDIYLLKQKILDYKFKNKFKSPMCMTILRQFKIVHGSQQRVLSPPLKDMDNVWSHFGLSQLEEC